MGGSGIEKNKEENTLCIEGIRIPKRAIIAVGIILLIASLCLWTGASFLAYDAGFKQGHAEGLKKCGTLALPALAGVEADESGIRLNVVSP